MTHSGGKPHLNVGDRGQRYEITYELVATGERKVFGWGNHWENVLRVVEGINKWPGSRNPEVFDRIDKKKMDL